MSVSVQKAIVTLSGGYDSVAALLWSLEHYKTRALFIDYGQPYLEQEQQALWYVVDQPQIQQHPAWRGLDMIRVDLRPALEANSSWIPYRNLVIGAVAVNWAVGHAASVVVVGSKSKEWRPDDPVSYKDSTLPFFEGLEQLVDEATEPGRRGMAPRFEMPLVGWDKKKVLAYIRDAGLDLTKLWNCYRTDGIWAPCGECAHCRETQHILETFRAFGTMPALIGDMEDSSRTSRHPDDDATGIKE